MEWGRLLSYISLLFISGSVSAIETLHKIEDLKGVEFGHEYPRHGLLLLNWLAGHVSFDQAEDVLLHFQPGRQDYGFQIYRKSFLDLDNLPDRAYYSVGSLSSEAVRTKLPPYVTHDYYNSLENPNRDMDRIVIRVHKSRPTRADKVYITQAAISDPENDFDKNKTFEISSKLLRQVKALQKPLNMLQTLLLDLFGALNTTKVPQDDPRLALTKEDLITHLQSKDKRLQTIFEQQDVRWLLSLAGYNIDGRYEVHQKTWLCSAEEPIHEESGGHLKTLCEGLSPVMIEVKSTEDGYVKLTWRGIPKNMIDQGVVIVLFGSDTMNSLETFELLGNKTSGSAKTFVALHHGLQPRLITFNFGTESGFFGIHYTVHWRGPQFDSANRVIPTEISGYNANLQLYTKGGYACARLYIKKSFTDWKNEFYNSWVGFYTTDKDEDSDYQKYQWVTKFEKVSSKDNPEDYLIYKYESSVSIGPGVQARFLYSRETVRSRILLNWYSATVKARTVPWEKNES